MSTSADIRLKPRDAIGRWVPENKPYEGNELDYPEEPTPPPSTRQDRRDHHLRGDYPDPFSGAGAPAAVDDWGPEDDDRDEAGYHDDMDMLDYPRHPEPANGWGEAKVSEGSRTPWGEAQYVDQIAPGICAVGTASHGGVKLSPERNRCVPPALRQRGGWYEEDCEEAVVEMTFPEEFTEDYLRRNPDTDSHYGRPDGTWIEARNRVRDWFPDAYEQATGEKVHPQDSIVRAEQAFYAQHANDQIGVSASMSEEHPGMVEVIAVVGGRRGSASQDGEETSRTYLVPKEEYRTRSQYGFIIDPARHTDITRPPAPKPPAPTRLTPGVPNTDRLTDRQRRLVERDLNVHWRSEDGSVRSLREILSAGGEGVTGKTMIRDENGKATYYLEQRTSQRGGPILPVTKATWDAVDIPDSRLPTQIAADDVAQANAALDRANAEVKRSFRNMYDPGDLNRAQARLQRAKARLEAALERQRTLLERED